MILFIFIIIMLFCTVYSCIASYLNMHTATMAEIIVSQLFSGRTHATIAVDLAIPLMRVLKAQATDKNLYKQSHAANVLHV